MSKKGMDSTLGFIMVLVVGLTIVVLISTILSGNFSGLEGFIGNNIELSLGGIS